jgi:outer membrane protein, multidrug efflux system
LSSPSNLKIDRQIPLFPPLPKGDEGGFRTAASPRRQLRRVQAMSQWENHTKVILSSFGFAQSKLRRRMSNLLSLGNARSFGYRLRMTLGLCHFAGRLSLVTTLSAVSALGIGCMVGPDFVRPVVEQPLYFKSQAASGEAPLMAREWWRLYGDPVLDQLIASAQASNQTLRQAVARVDQARALALVAVSFLSPTISLDPRFLRQRYSGNRDSTRTGQRQRRAVTINDWLIPLDLTYEIDVWGRVRRSVESAQAAATASAYDLGVVQLTVETDVAQFYYNLRALDAQVQILRENVAAYREQVRILSVQLKNGLVSPIVLNQAQAQLQSTLAQQRDIERARADQEHALAILCGQAAPLFSIAPNPMHEASPPAVPPGLPAQLLTRRPDVAEAEQNIVAANAQIGVAIANFYPTFTLTNFAGFESANASNLFDWRSAVASILPRVSIPIFLGGRLNANLEATEAVYGQTVAAYVNQVLVAYGDVEDALTDLHAFSDEVGNLREAVSASQNYLRLANAQFKFGLVDYLIVTDAERTLLSNQLSLAQAVNLQMAASIHLIKALGGGWTPS